jgi:hypothetical protein
MFNSGENLDYVVDNLINEKMIFKKGGALGVRNGQTFTTGRRSSFSASRRTNFSDENNFVRSKRPTTPMRTTKDMRRKMFNQIDTSPIGHGKYMEHSPRLTINNMSNVNTDKLYENDYLNTKHDIVASLRTVFKKPLNPDGTYEKN